MTEDEEEGDPGIIINLDHTGGVAVDPAGTTLHEAVAEAQDGVVWITEGGYRIAAIVSRQAAEALLRLRELLLAGEFGPFLEAIRSAPQAP